MAAVFLIAKSKTENGGMLTDGFATALSVASFEKSCEFLTKNTYLEGLIIAKTGKFFKTENSEMKLFV